MAIIVVTSLLGSFTGRSVSTFEGHLARGIKVDRTATETMNRFSTDAPDSEGRISPRHVFETRIRICLQRDSSGLILQGWTRNLSESGLNAFVAQALTLGELVTLEIPLSDSVHQSIPAKVVRALGTEYGFQFTALSAAQRTQIRSALKGRPAIPYHGSKR